MTKVTSLLGLKFMKKIILILKYGSIKYYIVIALILVAMLSSVFAIFPVNILGEISNLLSEGAGYQPIIVLLLIYLITVLAGTILRNVFCYLSSKFTNGLVQHIRSLCYKKFLDMPYSKIGEMEFGDVTNSVIKNTERIELIFNTSLFTMVSDIFDLIVMSFFIILISPPVLLIFFLVTPLTYFLAKRSGKLQKILAVEKINIEGTMVNKLHESYNNIYSIRTYSGQQYERDDFDRIIKKYRRLCDKSDQKLSSFYIAEKCSRTIGIVCALGYVISNIVHGNIDVGSFLVITMYAEKFFAPITNLIRYYQYIQQGMASIDAILVFLQQDEACSNAHLQFVESRPVLLRGQKISIAANNIPVAKNITFCFYDKKLNIIRGKNGAGKSSLMKALIGIYQVKEGTIYADNSLANGQWFAYVEQKSALFNRSILDNCLYPQTEESAAADHVKRVKQLLRQLDFKEDDWSKTAGENGVSLSGGEKQKILFIRAITGNFKVLLFDEILAGIDLGAQNKIIALLQEESKTRCIIMITHHEMELDKTLESNTVIIG